jgi:hypothetical protein
MRDTTVIAIAGLVTTATAPLISGRVQRLADKRRVALERSERDLDDRRQLLEEAAEVLSSYIDTTSGVIARAAFTEHWEKETFDKAVDPLVSAKKRAYAINRRLVIRLGRQCEVVTSYGAVLRICDEMSSAAVERFVRTEGAARPLDDRMTFVASDEADSRSRWEKYEAFLDAATRFVGEDS